MTDPRGLICTASEAASDLLGEGSTEPSLKALCNDGSNSAVSMAQGRFHQLVRAGALDEVEHCLLQSPALRDAGDLQTGLTPLCLAAESGHTMIAAALLAAGAAVDVRARNDSTPLMFAAFAGRVEMIRVLLSAGANPDLMFFNPSLNQANPSPTVSVLMQGWTELIA